MYYFKLWDIRLLDLCSHPNTNEVNGIVFVVRTAWTITSKQLILKTFLLHNPQTSEMVLHFQCRNFPRGPIIFWGTQQLNQSFDEAAFFPCMIILSAPGVLLSHDSRKQRAQMRATKLYQREIVCSSSLPLTTSLYTSTDGAGAGRTTDFAATPQRHREHRQTCGCASHNIPNSDR